MFGFSIEKFIVILFIAAVIIGPRRLPAYAAKLSQVVRSLRTMADSAKARVAEEMGPEFDDVDWKKMDPRQYDPRRIIRSALLDDEPAPRLSPPPTAPPSGVVQEPEEPDLLAQAFADEEAERDAELVESARTSAESTARKSRHRAA